MSFEYGQQLDSNGNPIGNGVYNVKSKPKDSIPIMIENFRALKDDSIDRKSVV